LLWQGRPTSVGCRLDDDAFREQVLGGFTCVFGAYARSWVVHEVAGAELAGSQVA